MLCLWIIWSAAEVPVIWPIALWLGLVPDGLLLWLLIVCSWSEPGRPVGPAGGSSHAQPAPGWGPGVCVPQQGQREWDVLGSAGTWCHGSQSYFTTLCPVPLFDLLCVFLRCCYRLPCGFFFSFPCLISFWPYLLSWFGNQMVERREII